MQLASGILLHGGTYRIERTLGQGSFGITYLATHTSLDRKVAIKEFFMKELNSRGNDGSITGMSDGSLSYNYGQKFKKEALNLSHLDHPNIVRVTDSFDENGTYYYVMDYIEGENLNDYLKHTAVSQKDAIDIITAVAKALQYMHDTKHMLHLDLKPGNIMRRASDGHIFLIDFGLSKHFSNSGQPETSTTIGLGTPGYAPIEQSNQAKNGEFRPTIDVYALGATLFKLLTRETPPPASDIVSDDELIEDKLSANGITGNIINVVVNAMLPNVRKRTQTISAFVGALTSNNTPATTTAATSMTNVQNEETLVAGASASKSEETIITPSLAKHPNFDESKYVIPSDFKNYPTTTGTKANSGDVEAMLALGMMALRGENVLQDTDTAYAWFQKLKNNGDDRGEKLINDWYKLKEKYKKQERKVVENKPTEEAPSSKSGWIILCVIVAIIVIIIAANSGGASNGDTQDSYCDSTYVERYKVSRGTGTYYWTGYLRDGVPTGYGTAQYINDPQKRKEYSGVMCYGQRNDDNATLTYTNGDTYQGSFNFDSFENGTYFSFSTGEKYIGTFRNNQPYNGKWYDKNGNVIGTVTNGL